MYNAICAVCGLIVEQILQRRHEIARGSASTSLMRDVIGRRFSGGKWYFDFRTITISRRRASSSLAHQHRSEAGQNHDDFVSLPIHRTPCEIQKSTIIGGQYTERM